MSEIEQPNWIAGFWRRLGAFMIDSLILGLFGQLLGLFFADALFQLGPWGRALGFIIAVVYFGVQESRLLNGQTLGKRLLRIAVVDEQGRALSLPRSLLRAAVFSLPISLNNAQFPVDTGAILTFVLTLIIFGGLLSFAYFLIFNRTTRQAPYDLLVGALVVKNDLDAQPTEPVWRGHYAMVSALILGVLLLLFATLKFWLPPAITTQLSTVHQAIESEPEVLRAWVSTSLLANDQPGRNSYLAINTLIDSARIDNLELAKKLATMAVFADASVADKDVIVVQLTYGYDIGIASFWRAQTFNFTPAEL